MKACVFLPLILILAPTIQNPAPVEHTSPVVVVSSRWDRTRITVEQADSMFVPPVAAVTSANKVIERNRRADIPAGARDPNADTIDGRSAAIEKSVQESRTPKPMDGFAYRIKIHNAHTKAIEALFWEYQFIDQANVSVVSRRQFLCPINVKPEKDKNIEAFSISGPSDVVSLETLSRKSGKLFEEKVLINRVEFTDGTIWQRKGWHLSDVKVGYERALRAPWGSEMCRAL